MVVVSLMLIGVLFYLRLVVGRDLKRRIDQAPRLHAVIWMRGCFRIRAGDKNPAVVLFAFAFFTSPVIPESGNRVRRPLWRAAGLDRFSTYPRL
jgi:hypothetical protein